MSQGELALQQEVQNMKDYASQIHSALRDALACMVVDKPADPKLYIGAFLLARSHAPLSPHARALLETHLPSATLKAVMATRLPCFDAHAHAEHMPALAAALPAVGAAANAPRAVLAAGGDVDLLTGQLYIAHGRDNALVPAREEAHIGADKLAFIDPVVYQKINAAPAK